MFLKELSKLIKISGFPVFWFCIRTWHVHIKIGLITPLPRYQKRNFLKIAYLDVFRFLSVRVILGTTQFVKSNLKLFKIRSEYVSAWHGHNHVPRI
jgi:hypothetical protein